MKKLSFLIGLSQVFIFCYAQNVGIGTTTPLEKLSVASSFGYGVSHEASGIKLSTYIDGGGGFFGTVSNNPFHLYTNNGAAQFTLLQNGNVGIGQVNPVTKLEVNGNMLATGNIASSGNMQVTGTATASSFVFSAPKIYYYSLSGADFTEVNSGSLVQTEGISGGGIYMTGAGSTTGFVAPVHLPDNAIVSRMTVYFKDVSVPINLTVFLQRSDLITQMATISSSGTPGETSSFDNTILTPAISNAGSAYVIYAVPQGGAWPGDEIIVRRVILEYTLAGF